MGGPYQMYSVKVSCIYVGRNFFIVNRLFRLHQTRRFVQDEGLGNSDRFGRLVTTTSREIFQFW